MFIQFLNSLKTPNNASLIEAIQKGYNTLFEEENNQISYDGWRMLTDTEISNEYEWEYSKVDDWTNNAFPTLNNFEKAVRKGKVIALSPEMDRNVSYRSRCSSIEELKNLTSSYRFPRDVDRIINGIKQGDEIPYPIILEKNGNFRVMSGNTRLDVAFLLKVVPKVLIVSVEND